MIHVVTQRPRLLKSVLLSLGMMTPHLQKTRGTLHSFSLEGNVTTSACRISHVTPPTQKGVGKSSVSRRNGCGTAFGEHGTISANSAMSFLRGYHKTITAH